MAARWGTPCNTCGLDKAMCLSGHDDEAADDRREADLKLRVILASVQELRLLVPDLFGRPNILVDAVLDEVEIRLCEQVYGVRWVDLEQAA